MDERRGRGADVAEFGEEDSQKDKFLVFKLGSEEYGIGIHQVTEIIGIQRITAVPDMPAFIRGVINLRGKIIPTMDVRSRFGLQEAAYHDRTCIVVVEMDGIAMGLIVDEVKEVLDIPPEQIAPPPRAGREGRHPFVAGLGKAESGVKILLDIRRLLGEEEAQQLVQAC